MKNRLGKSAANDKIIYKRISGEVEVNTGDGITCLVDFRISSKYIWLLAVPAGLA